MWWKYLCGILLAAVTVLAFSFPPPQAELGDASRIFFYHVPTAFVAFVAFIMAAVCGVLYLRSRDVTYDHKAAAAAEIGLTFTVIATVTGAIFAKVTWGMFWNWDPRQTTIVIVLLLYGAYLALRQAVTEPGARARLSAVYIILAGLLAPLLFFVLPRVYPSLHPKDTLVSSGGGFTMTPPVAATFAASLVGFVLLFMWMFQLASRGARITNESTEAGASQ